MTFFEMFFVVAHLLIETKLFCSYQIFISSVVQRNHGGTTKKNQFLAKKIAAGRKNDFFYFSPVALLPIKTKLFCFY